SGCGKSTLLKILCGIHRNYSGNVTFDGHPLNDLAGADIRIGYVPQNYGLLAWKTIRGNILLPQKIKNLCGAPPHTPLGEMISPSPPRSHEQIITGLGLTDVLDRYPREVSGGQQQRAALARAFALKPDLLLMDEPFSALDAFTAEKSQRLFLDLWRDFPVTTLFITHNMREAALLGQRVLLMYGPPGRIAGSLDNPAFEAPNEEDGSANPAQPGEAVEREALRLRLVAEMSEFFHEQTR
ncbi:MAG: ATP-binding cassette domain-containing protein, partial [Deltaproteobacteria bacterium]|nr:ATP-binding cassette domain-containing protein [Deltaproteobacteria bacterium]